MHTLNRLAGGLLAFGVLGATLAGGLAGDGARAVPSESRVGSLIPGATLRVSDGKFADGEPSVAHDTSSHRYLVVWEDWRRRETRGWEIYGRLLEADGTAVGPSFRVSGPVDIGDDRNPAVVWNETSAEYFVVWQAGGGIVGRRVGPAGALLGLQQPISLWETEERDPAVAWNAADNQYLVVWQDARYHGNRGWEIYGRRVAASGRPLGRELRISGPPCRSHDWAPGVVWNGTENEYLVAWQETKVYGRRVGADGARLGPTLRISSPPAVVLEEGVTGLAWNAAADEYLVVWADHRVSDRISLYGRRLSADGTRLGRDTILSGPAAEGPRHPAVLWNQDQGRYLVAWVDDRWSNTRFTDIVAIEVAAGLIRSGHDIRISDPDAVGYDLEPAAAPNTADGRYLIVWKDDRDRYHGEDDIYGRLVDSTG